MAAKSKASSTANAVDEAPLAEQLRATEAPTEDVAERFVGQWNRLISTTNWEKGRIICQWREALEASGASVTAYSDEAWAQLVGGVTSQHVGRLRRVYQRFGGVFDQYEGLYWSHFQAGLDWNDAEMWFEGAILNAWSVSQMRGKRWETLGNAGEPPADDEAASGAVDEDAAVFDSHVNAEATPPGTPKKLASPPTADNNADADEDASEPFEDADESADELPAPTKKRSRLAVDVDDLPQDIADAFEQFKLAIIAQRRLRWSETTPEAVIECLDALRELALAPTDD